MKILAVVAHPDDAAIFCGGTLAKHADRGDEVHIIYMTRGEYGSAGQVKESELAEERSQEARQSAEVLGAESSFQNFHDGRVTVSLENRRVINETIRKHRPNLLITHDRESNHPDHRATGRLVTDAYYQASLSMVDSNYEPVECDNIYYFGKPSSGFEPQIYVNITDYLNEKEEAIRCHETQIDFLEQHGGFDRNFSDPVEGIRAETRHYGRKSGVRYAEGFGSLHKEAKDYLE